MFNPDIYNYFFTVSNDYNFPNISRFSSQLIHHGSHRLAFYLKAINADDYIFWFDTFNTCFSISLNNRSARLRHPS